MRIKLVLSLCLIGLPLTTGFLAAAEPLSLEQAVRYAVEHNLTLQAAQEQSRAAAENTAAARGARLPQVDVRYMRRRSDNPLDAFADKLDARSVDPATDFTSGALNFPDPSTLHNTELSVRVPVYTGGKLSAAIREARDSEQAARLQADRARELTEFHTRQAYLAAQAAAQAAAIAEDAVQAARGHAETTTRLVREGRIVVSDKMTAELNLAATQSAYEQALNRQRRSLDELRLVMGMPLDDALTIEPWRPTTALPAFTEMTADEQTALARRKDLQASQSLVGAGRARVDVARASLKPQVSLVAANNWYDRSASLDNKSTSVMGVVSMNLFSGGQTRHEVAAARYRTSEREIRLRDQERQVRNEVRSAHDNLQEAIARNAIAAQNAEKALETVRLVKKRYGEGRTILIDVLMAERVLVEARNEELMSSYNVAVGQAALRLAEGATDPPDRQ